MDAAATMTLAETVAVAFGLLCVGLTIRQSIWCWPTGLVQVSLYIFIFYEEKLYSDVILHTFYVLMQFYGWHHWLSGGRDRSRLLVSRMSPNNLTAWTLITIFVTGIWGYGMATYTDAAVPYWDAFIAVTSLVAQWLMSRKRLESWTFWIAVDIVADCVYYYKTLYLTAGLYTVFLLMCVMGMTAWKKSLAAASEELRTDEDRLDSGKICSAAQRTSIAD